MPRTKPGGWVTTRPFYHGATSYTAGDPVTDLALIDRLNRSQPGLLAWEGPEETTTKPPPPQDTPEEEEVKADG